MTKVFIINVDLNDKIDSIIQNQVKDVTGKAKELLADAISIKKAEQKIKDEKKEKVDGISLIMDQCYDLILQSGDKGYPIDQILEHAKPHIANASAFTTRMKTYLRSKGNVYIIKRKTRAKINLYYFETFNLEEDQQ